jgi:hypothetical protein
MSLLTPNPGLIQKLHDDLIKHQRKYDYHKKITQGYLELIQNTQQKLQELSNVL